MDPNYGHQHGDGEEFRSDVKKFLKEKCTKYMKLKNRLRKLIPSSRICSLAIPKHCSCPPKVHIKRSFRPHIQIINLDVRTRTRLEQLALPYPRKLIETRNTFRHVYHPKRYFYVNKLIRKSLFSLYSRLANVQAPKTPFRPKPWTKKEWRKHQKALFKLATPKRVFVPPKAISDRIPLEELLPRIRKLSKAKKIFLPPPEPKPKNLSDMTRTLQLAKPKDWSAYIFEKVEPVPIDRSKPYKLSRRILGLAEHKDRSANESDMKENPFQVSPNALKYKCREGSRLANLAKPKEYEEPPINPYAFTVNKKALKAKASKRTAVLAQPKGSS